MMGASGHRARSHALWPGLLLFAASLPACLFLVNEAPGDGNGGNGEGGNGNGGDAILASATSSTSTGGGEGGGGPPPPCVATLADVGSTTRPGATDLVVTPDDLIDVFVLSQQNGAVQGHASAALATDPTVQTAPLLDDPQLTPHHLAGVVVSNGNVNTYRYDGSSLALDPVWNGGEGRDVLEAVSNGSGYYGRLGSGDIVALTALNAPLEPALHTGPTARLSAHAGGISWVDTNGLVGACSTPACSAPVSSQIPGGPFVGDSIAFDPVRARFFAVVAANASAKRRLFTGTLPEGTTPPVELTTLPFDDVLAAALTPEHLVVLSDEDVRVCCLDSLFGDTPCGEPVTVLEGKLVAAHESRVVVHVRPLSGPIELRAYDIDPDGAGGAGGAPTR